MAQRRTGAITFKGNAMTLLGPEVKAGEPAPDFRLTANDLSDVTLTDGAGKVRVLTAVPSLDTGVCSIMTKKFNDAAQELGDSVLVQVVSLDLPFAQKRWCGAEGAANVVALSDYKDHAFGEAYGVLIDELKLLTRAVFVIDGDGVVRYAEYVPEVTSEPDYEAALAVARELAG